MKVFAVFGIYLIFVNLLGFLLMAIDKNRARQGAFRIPEANLFLVAIFGGSLGSILGMHLFRHKTRHMTFVIGMPLILLLQLIAALLIYRFVPMMIIT